MRTFVVIDIPHVPDHVYREALTLGLKDLAYREGITPPHYPVPVVLTMRDSYGMPHSATRWMDNFDSFWTEEHGARGFSL
jgi:hypothetical protein